MNTQNTTQTLGTNERTLHRFIEEFINGGRESVLQELVDPNYTYRSPSESIHGRQALAEMFRGYRAAFPDLSLVVGDVLSDGDKTVLDFTLTGTQHQEFMGIPAAGRSFSIRGVVITRYDDGKIVDDWEILDQLSMLQQLGALHA